jgi:transketolase
MQEGVAMEAIAFAGHFKLDNLILIYDSNDVTLDAMAKETQSEDAAKAFRGLEWDVQTVDGNDMTAFLAAFEKAKAATGKPQLIIARTLIGKGIPKWPAPQKAHGEGARSSWTPTGSARPAGDEHFYVSPETCAPTSPGTSKKLTARLRPLAEDLPGVARRQSTLPRNCSTPPSTSEIPADPAQPHPGIPADAKIATRKAGSDVLQPIAEAVPCLIGGSRICYGSTLNYINAARI